MRRWWWQAILVLVLPACAGTDGGGGPDCGDAVLLKVDGQHFCVIEQTEVVETGFLCPPELSMPVQQGGLVICASSSELPPGMLDEVVEAYGGSKGGGAGGGSEPDETPDETPDEPEQPACVDEDGDGHCADKDCNDHSVHVYPGAPEVPDGHDNDCDGHVDITACSQDSDCPEGMKCHQGGCHKSCTDADQDGHCD